MNFKLDLGKVFTGLVTALVIFLAGAVWDFQNLKGRVGAVEKNVIGLESRIEIIAKITCKRAIVDKIENAEEICLNVIR